MHITIPAHVAIIMDGNGRWAKKRMLPRSAGHRAGVEALRRIVEHCGNSGVRFLTVYAFSTENFRRPPDEVATLMNLIIEYLKRETKTLVKNDIRLQFLGDRSLFSPAVQAAVDAALQETADGKKMVFNICLGYGGRDEIVKAVREIVAEGTQEVDEKTVADHLYTAGMPDPDLIIRTSGEERLSNFLLYQAAYAEFYFTKTLWPDFDEACLDKAFEEFSRRQRRYGGT